MSERLFLTTIFIIVIGITTPVIAEAAENTNEKACAEAAVKASYYSHKQMYDEAIAEFTKIIKLNPGEAAQAYFDRGNV